ncbi:MAG: ABC transporter permease, partial [Coriobacteriia bacterium]|nr:ABC transporter permease [Coriobacteriia bacterium]
MSRFTRYLTRVLHIAPRTLKVLRDLSANKSRTFLVVLSIAVGIFAIASTLGARQVLLREFDRGFEDSQKFSISYTLSDFSRGVRGVVRQIDARGDVTATSARRIVSGSFTTVPSGMSQSDALSTLPAPGEDREIIHLQAVEAAEFDHSSVSRFYPLSARAWPPGPTDIIVEASALQVYDFEIGDRLLLEVGQGKAVFRIAGFAHDLNAVPTMFFGQVEAFVVMDALPRLNVLAEPNRVLVNVEPQLSRVQVARIADSIQEQQFDPAGLRVDRMEVPEPGFHFFGSLFEAVSVLLLVMAFMALALSAFLVITTTNAILVQQTRQLGIMKAIGGKRRQITGLYIGLVLSYGVLALALGLPIGIIFGNNFIDYAAGVLNFHIADMSYPLWVIALLCAVGLLLPLLAALVPITRGVKRPIVDALGSYANLIGFGGGWVDRILSKVTFLSRPTALALRSTFARKGRLMLTLTTLTLASAVVMSVFSAHASLQLTVDTIGSWW